MAALLHISTYLFVWEKDTTEAAVMDESCAATDVSPVSINNRTELHLNTVLCSSTQCFHYTRKLQHKACFCNFSVTSK